MKSVGQSNAGFTLVELLIVVVMIAILAAVAIPQFNSVIAETQESSIASGLRTIRQAIEVYKLQHDDALPGDNFVDQLSLGTDEQGNPGSKYGPYLREPWPYNPVAKNSDVKIFVIMPTAPGGNEETR